MNNRYKFLTSRDELETKNLVKNAFLAAKNGHDVDLIISAILTTDENIKIGRRIMIAGALMSGMTQMEICDILKAGKDTVTLVAKHLARYAKGFELIQERQKNLEKKYKEKAYSLSGGSKLVFKKKTFTGFKRIDVER